MFTVEKLSWYYEMNILYILEFVSFSELKSAEGWDLWLLWDTFILFRTVCYLYKRNMATIKFLLARFSAINLGRTYPLCSDIFSSKLCNLPSGIGSKTPITFQPLIIGSAFIHTGSVNNAWYKQSGPRKWHKYNDKVYPPQDPSEERRPAVRTVWMQINFV